MDPSIDKWAIRYKVWDEIIYSFSNFNDAVVEGWEWIGDFIAFFTGQMITYPCWILS